MSQPERDDLGRFASPGAHGEERAEPKNYFRAEADGFNIDMPSTLTLEPPAEAPGEPVAEPVEEERPAAESAPDAAKAAATRALAEMLGWKEPPADKPTTAKGEPWLSAEQWVEKFSPRKTREELDALRSDFDRRVSERVGREIESVRLQISSAVKLQRDQLDADYRRYIANAQTPDESFRRQQLRTKALEDFDKQFAQPTAPSARPAEDTPPPEYVSAYQEFAARNRAWFDPTKKGGHRAMTVFAQDVVAEVAQDPRFAGNPKAEFEEIERRVREEFKEHPLFRPANGHANGSQPASRPPDIEGAPRRGAGSTAGKGWSALTEAQKQMFRQVHVPFGSFKDNDKDRERYAAQIHADAGKKRGFDIQ